MRTSPPHAVRNTASSASSRASASATVSTAIRHAGATGYPKVPQLIAGNATVRTPTPTASRSDAR